MMNKANFFKALCDWMALEGVKKPQDHIELGGGKLRIFACSLRGIPKLLEEYADKIKTLELDELKLAEFPSVIMKMENLKVLRMFGVGLENIDGIDIPGRLTELTISNMPLRTLEHLEHMLELKKLDISGTRLWDFPKLPPQNQLETINISNTGIKTLPVNLGLPKLRSLNVSFSPVETLPECWLPEGLESLSIGYSSIKKLPESLSRAHNLRHLNVTHTALKQLPSLIGMSKLKSLEMSNTGIKFIPEGIHTSNLEYLGVCMCEFDELPEQLVLDMLNRDMPFVDQRGKWEMPSLDNESLPSKMQKGVFIHGLILKKMDVRYLKKGRNTRDFIQVYYQARDREPGHEVKIVVLGDADSGKSMMIQQVFDIDRLDDRGLGLRIYQDPTIALPGLDRDARLRVWEIRDTPQLVLANPLFFTEGCLYVVVLDAREGQQVYRTAQYWLKYIEKHAPYDHVLFVMTFCEPERKGMFSSATILENDCLLKGKRIVYVRANADYREEDIQTLREAMSAEIKDMVSYYHEYPLAWKRAERQLLSLLEVRSTVSSRRFRQLCAYYEIGRAQTNTSGESYGVEAAVISSFLQWLRETGAVQYVSERADAQEGAYQLPAWLFDSVWFANGVTEIVSQAAEGYGELEYRKLFEGMDDWHIENLELYTNDSIRVLVRALQNRGLCFEQKGTIWFPTMRNIHEEELLSSFGSVEEAGQGDALSDLLKDDGHRHYRINGSFLSIDMLANLITSIARHKRTAHLMCGYGCEGVVFRFLNDGMNRRIVVLCTLGVDARVDIHMWAAREEAIASGNRINKTVDLQNLGIAMWIRNEIFGQYKVIQCPVSVEVRQGNESAYLPLAEMLGCIERNVTSYFMGSLRRWIRVDMDLRRHMQGNLGEASTQPESVKG